jgi:hypothetical protein
MRLLLGAAFILASGFVVGILAPRGAATTSTPGDGCLVVENGLGRVAVSLTRGVVFGRFYQGSVRIDDPIQGDGSTATVSGAPPVRLSDHRTSYTGDQVRFRTTGAVRIVVNAQAIQLSAVGKGSAVLFAGDSAGGLVPAFSGRFSVDAASFCQDNLQQMPAVAKTYPISSPVAG